MKIRSLILVASFFLLTTHARAATQVACTAMFQKADYNSDGTIGGSELTPFVPSLMARGFNENTIDQMFIRAADFKERCMRDELGFGQLQ